MRRYRYMGEGRGRPIGRRVRTYYMDGPRTIFMNCIHFKKKKSSL